MKTLASYLITAVFLLVYAATPGRAQAPAQLVVFGDSLSDTGNSLVAAGLPQPPYVDGRWTDGPNWVDYFAPLAGFPAPGAYLRTGGTNFAVGGATSEYAAGEVGAYIAISGWRIPANNLYLLWVGANDFRAGLAPSQTLDYISSEVVSLAFAGARRIVVLNIPDISLTPDVRAAGGPTVAAAQTFVANVNASLPSRLALLSAVFGINVTSIDANATFVSVVNTPGAYGFADSIDAAFNPDTGVVQPNPDSYVFWDGFHPTTPVHRLAALAILNALGNAAAAPVPPSWTQPAAYLSR